MYQLINGNAIKIPLASGSIHCIVTSPPYYGQRNYQVENQIGLEPTPDEYVANMVQVFREVWRVLRDDGTVWLNLGDSYAANPSGSSKTDMGIRAEMVGAGSTRPNKVVGNLKPKDLIGIPWRVAFALQADGWWLRRDIIWAKGCSFNYMGGSTMPESVKDRPTTGHEYVFILTKSKRYFYDYYGSLEDALYDGRNDTVFKGSEKYSPVTTETVKRIGGERWPNQVDGKPKRNMRSVWVINPANYKGDHYAVMPRKLVEPCILAGCPEKVCPKCGAPWIKKVVTEYYKPSCKCGIKETIPGIVLDPFIGSGTVCIVARQHGRRSIGIDLNYNYLANNARERLNTPWQSQLL